MNTYDVPIVCPEFEFMDTVIKRRAAKIRVEAANMWEAQSAASA